MFDNLFKVAAHIVMAPITIPLEVVNKTTKITNRVLTGEKQEEGLFGKSVIFDDDGDLRG